MNAGAWSLYKRGVRTSVLLLAILIVASLLTIFNSRPTHAEGFLVQTVRCTVRVLLTADCNKDAAQPIALPVAPANTPQANAPQASTPAQAQGQAPAQAPSVTSGAGSGAGSAPVTGGPSGGVYFAPISTEEVAIEHPNSIQATVAPYTYKVPKHTLVAMANSQLGSVAMVSGGEPAVAVVATNEGWRLFGFAWYWWVGFLAIITGAIAAFRLRYLRKSSVL